MRPLLEDLTLLEDHDLVAARGGRDPMGDEQHRALLRLAVDRFQDRRLRPRVHRAQRIVEHQDRRLARALIRENIGLTRTGGTTRLFRRDATRLGPNDSAPFSLVFLDPPYGRGLGETALAAAAQGGWLAPGALVVWEENTPQAAPPGFAPLESRRYGDTHVTFLERSDAP